MTSEQKATYVGVKARTETGLPAKLYVDDTPINVTTTGTATGEVSNLREYTENGRTGHEFDFTVLSNGAAGASLVAAEADGDADSGETRMVRFEVNTTVTDPEAFSFSAPAPVIEAQ